MNPKGVLYISPNAHLGGAEKACEFFLKYHDRSRYAPAIGFLRDGPLVKEFRKYNVPVFLFPEVRMRELAKHRQLISAISQVIHDHKISILHSSMVYGHFFGGQAANKSKIKNVWFQHGPVGKTFDKAVSLIRTDGILLNSKFTEGEQKKIMWRNFPTHIVYSGVEVPDASTATYEQLRVRTRARYGFADEHIVLGSVGRIQEWKGQLELLKAFNVARKKDDRIRLLICGSADLGNKQYEHQLRNFVIESGLTGLVAFTGFMQDIEAGYRAIDVLVHSSTIPEPFGLVPLEGMIRNLPVIASPWGGPSETVIDGVSGILVNPHDTQALAEAIERVTVNLSLRIKLGKAGTEQAKQFLAPKFVERVEQIYSFILGKTKAEAA